MTISSRSLSHLFSRGYALFNPPSLLDRKFFPTSTPARFIPWNSLCNAASSLLDGIYSMPQALHVFCTSPPRSICICVSRVRLRGRTESAWIFGAISAKGSDADAEVLWLRSDRFRLRKEKAGFLLAGSGESGPEGGEDGGDSAP
ncbi:MAG: hypothetical protein Q9198_010357 [Flavoplaca austrocitrina]